MQEDKLPVFDSVETLSTCLAVLDEMMKEVKFNTVRMAETAGEDIPLPRTSQSIWSERHAVSRSP